LETSYFHEPVVATLRGVVVDAGAVAAHQGDGPVASDTSFTWKK